MYGKIWFCRLKIAEYNYTVETFTILTGEYDACPQSKLIQTEIMYDVGLTVASL